jgi:hypothetical protein
MVNYLWESVWYVNSTGLGCYASSRSRDTKQRSNVIISFQEAKTNTGCYTVVYEVVTGARLVLLCYETVSANACGHVQALHNIYELTRGHGWSLSSETEKAPGMLVCGHSPPVLGNHYTRNVNTASVVRISDTSQHVSSLHMKQSSCPSGLEWCIWYVSIASQVQINVKRLDTCSQWLQKTELKHRLK